MYRNDTKGGFYISFSKKAADLKTLNNFDRLVYNLWWHNEQYNNQRDWQDK